MRIGLVQQFLPVDHATIGITLDTHSYMLPVMGGEAAGAISEAPG